MTLAEFAAERAAQLEAEAQPIVVAAPPGSAAARGAAAATPGGGAAGGGSDFVVAPVSMGGAGGAIQIDQTGGECNIYFGGRTEQPHDFGSRTEQPMRRLVP